MTVDKQRNRARLELKATRERIQAIDSQLKALGKQGPTQAEAIRAAEDWINAKTRRDLSGFTDALAKTGAVDDSTLPGDPWTVAAITNPQALKRHFAQAIADSGKFSGTNRYGEIDALEAEKAQLQETERRQEQQMRNLEGNPDEVTV